jgi:adenine-specific DNA-methyltransferase
MKSEKKFNGSYYTPNDLTNFIIDYTIKKFNCKESINILEPSVGDGAFLRAILDHEKIRGFEKISITLVEKDANELQKALQITQNKYTKNIKIHAFNQDFLDFLNINTSKYSLIVGNPPYIKKNYLSSHQIEMCGKIHLEAGLSRNKIKNIWTSFVVGCVNCLSDDGIFAFVLPSELLQVKFATEIRNFLYKKFERVEVFTFNQFLFECNGQETVLVIGYKKSDEKNVFYTDIEDIKDLKEMNFTLKPNVSIQTTSTKWTHHFLSTYELDLIYKLKKNFKSVNDYCTSKAGIVTAANNYFIVNEATVYEFGLQLFIKPIIQRSIFINGGVVFRKKDFDLLVKSGKPSFLISLEGLNEEEAEKIGDYLNVGIKKRIDKRYKCLNRKRWFEVPNIGIPPVGFFFKRSYQYPKLLKNESDILVTDSAYKIEMKDNYSIDGFVYSFYNSLTIIFAELEGRYYGGGVLELTPNEFKKLPLPYVEIDLNKFNEFVKDSEANDDRNILLGNNDRAILYSNNGISLGILDSLSTIRKKLMERRMRIIQKCSINI